MSLLARRHDLWIALLPRSPRDHGRVHRCVVRTGHGQRATPGAIEVRVGEGVVGDWHGPSPPGGGKDEVSLVNVHVVRSLAKGDEARMALVGDNLHVDLDLSEANLPVGTLLRVGTAELEITDQPHRPCRHFTERFGAEGAKRVAHANRRGLRGRGVLTRVVRSGRIADGDAIAVVRPGAAGQSPA